MKSEVENMGLLDDLMGKGEEAPAREGLPFNISTALRPVRLSARKESTVEILVTIKNVSGSPFMASVSAEVPKTLGFENVGMAKIKEIRKGEPNPKAVRYHLLQLKRLGIIETKKRRYRFVLAPMQENEELSVALAHVYRQRMDSSFEKMKKALSMLEKTF